MFNRWDRAQISTVFGKSKQMLRPVGMSLHIPLSSVADMFAIFTEPAIVEKWVSLWLQVSRWTSCRKLLQWALIFADV